MMTLQAPDLHSAIARLAMIDSVHDGGGLVREVYTPEYSLAVSFVAGLMEDAGLLVRQDAAGNLFGRWEGGEPELAAVWTGSHFDTTLNAGAYDGVLGVLGAIAAVSRLRDCGFSPRRTIEVIGFAGEEPRFGAGCIGSRAMVGALSRAELDLMVDRHGTSIAAAMTQVGLDPDAIGAAEFDPASVSAFVELHIEQGAVLETRGIGLGVVERIAAPHQLRVTFLGKPRHAGSTPMSLRHDALCGAAELVLSVESLAAGSPSGTTVGTVGRVAVAPGAVNVIPGEVHLDVDVRDVELSAREAVVSAITDKVVEIAARRGLEANVRQMVVDTPAPCDSRIVAAVREVCEEREIPYLNMHSGAYHDAMVLGARIPIGMIFVPSRDGLSHHPDEYTAPEELDLGVEVLAGTLARLAG